MAGKYVNTAKGRRWQNADGTYAYEQPGGGRQFGAELIEFIAPGTNQRTAELRQNPRPSQPDGDPTVYAEHAGTMYYETKDGRPVYETNGVVYDQVSHQQVLRKGDETGTFDGAFSITSDKGSGLYRGYKGTNLRNIDNQVIAEGTQVWKVPDSTGGNGGGNNSGRNDSRTSPTGVSQKGTNMSRSFNDLLATTNTSGYQPFSSNQLPTTAGSPDSAITPKTQQILAGIQAGKQTDMSIEGYQEPTSSRTAAQKGVLAGIQGGQKTDQGIEGYKKPGSTSRLDAALNDKAGMQSYMSKFSSGDRERAANRAFLDTEDSMLALRAKEAVNGVVYANQKHYISGESGDDAAVAITRDQARGISSGKTDAQTLLKAHIDKNKATKPDTAPETPAEAQDPLTPAASAVKDGFAAGAKTDFNLNNAQGKPQSGVGPVVKPEIVENADLTGKKGEEYLRKLDAGELF